MNAFNAPALGRANPLSRSDQLARLQLESTRKNLQCSERWVDFGSLDLADVIPVQPRALAELLLRDSLGLARSTDGDPKGGMQRQPNHRTEAAVLTTVGLPVKTGGMRRPPTFATCAAV